MGSQILTDLAAIVWLDVVLSDDNALVIGMAASALATITIADVSISIDNVLAVVSIAHDDRAMLVFGLALSIMLMAF